MHVYIQERYLGMHREVSLLCPIGCHSTGGYPIGKDQLGMNGSHGFALARRLKQGTEYCIMQLVRGRTGGHDGWTDRIDW